LSGNTFDVTLRWAVITEEQELTMMSERAVRWSACFLKCVVVTAGLSWWISFLFQPQPVSSDSKYSMVSLQLAPDVETANRILGDWKQYAGLAIALQNLQHDAGFIWIF